jgi:hypothetical protein
VIKGSGVKARRMGGWEEERDQIHGEDHKRK